jgi:hypothetical protein
VELQHWAHKAEGYTVNRIQKGRWGIKDSQGRPVPGREFKTRMQAEAAERDLLIQSWQQVATPRPTPDEWGSHVGKASGRPFSPKELRLPMQRRTIEGAQITPKGIARIEQHVARFGPDKANQRMIQRLRDISAGRVKPTQTDLQFYTHELREFEHYKAMGWERGMPRDPDRA